MSCFCTLESIPTCFAEAKMQEMSGIFQRSMPNLFRLTSRTKLSSQPNVISTTEESAHREKTRVENLQTGTPTEDIGIQKCLAHRKHQAEELAGRAIVSSGGQRSVRQEMDSFDAVEPVHTLAIEQGGLSMLELEEAMKADNLEQVCLCRWVCLLWWEIL